MANPTNFIPHIRSLIAQGDLPAALKTLSHLLEGSPHLSEAIHLQSRHNAIMKQIRMGVVNFEDATLTQNQITTGLLDLLDFIQQKQTEPQIKTELERFAVQINKNTVNNSTINAGGNVTIGDTTNNHTGSGDIVLGNKIDRQINFGNKGTYIENQNNHKEEPKSEALSKEEKKVEQAEKEEKTGSEKIPESSIGLVGFLVSQVPKPIRAIVAILVLIVLGYFAYLYLMNKKGGDKEEPKKEITTKITPLEKVYVSGRLSIDGKEPKPNEVKRLVLKNMPDINSTKLDAMGKYTFENVIIPPNKKLLVEITFKDGVTVPTEELSVGDANPENHTVSLPDLDATSPKPAKSGKPASNWSVGTGNSVKIINQINTNGDNNATQH